MVDCLMGWGWSSLLLLSISLSLGWLIPKAIYFTHKLHAWVIGVAIETCYHCYRSNFHRSDLSSRQLTSLMNCKFKLLAWLLKLAIALTDLTFISLTYHQDNSLYSWIVHSVLPFIWASTQLYLLDHLGTSLDSSVILRLLHYQEKLSFDRGSIEKLWCWRPQSRSNCV